MSGRLRSDEAGTVLIEYATVFALVSLGGALAIMTLGLPLLRLYVYGTTLLSVPIP